MFEIILAASITLDRVIDLRDHKVSNDMPAEARTYWSSVIQFVLILPLVGFITLPNKPQLLLLVAGVALLSDYGRTRWFRALRTSNLSSLVPFTRFSSIFVLLFGIILFGDRATIPKATGALLIVVGAIGSTIHEPRTALKDFMQSRKMAFYVIMFALSSASITVLQKYMMSQGITVLNAFFLLRFFQLIVSLAGGSSAKVSIRRFSDFHSFVLNRLMQTCTALIFLVCLNNLTLSNTVPITAMSPFFAIAIEGIDDRLRGKRTASQFKLAVLIPYSIVAIGLILFSIG